MQDQGLPQPRPAGIIGRNSFITLVPGACLLAVLLWAQPPQDHIQSSYHFVFWAALVVVASLTPVALRRGGVISSSSGPLFATILLFGPEQAMWFGVIAGITLSVVLVRKNRPEFMFCMIQPALVVYLAGRVFVATGGIPGFHAGASIHSLGVSDILPLVLCAGTYYAADVVISSAAVSMTYRISLPRAYMANYLSTLPDPLLFFPVGLLLAVGFVHAHYLGALLFFFPLLLTLFRIRRWIELLDFRVSLVAAQSSAIDARDPYTKGHSHRVARYGMMVAREMGIDERSIDVIECAGLVHDMGKVAVAPEVLTKPVGLSLNERELMKRHPKAGAEIVENLGFYNKATEMVLAHHERPDGNGYPRGLRAADIPAGARILNVVDAFDAMTSDRTYRKALSLQEAIQELCNGAGSEFDSAVVEVVVDLCQRGAMPVRSEDS